MAKINHHSPHAVDDAMDAVAKILESRSMEMRFHEILRYFDAENQQERILLGKVITNALYRLKKQGKITKRIAGKNEYYMFVYPDNEWTLSRLAIVAITLAAMFYLMKII